MSTKRTSGPLLLCILDGVGLNPNSDGNAVERANTPTLDKLFRDHPNTTLTTFGKKVGLPEGQMGNSEVGHLNIGAGRIVKQWLLRIEEAFSQGEVFNTPSFQSFLSGADETQRIHLFGLYSFGGVHSDGEHLFSLLKLLDEKRSDTEVVLHLIADGRDTAPKQLSEDLPILTEKLSQLSLPVRIGSLSGRYYAMDRDSRMERTERAYRTMCGESDTPSITLDDLESYLHDQYTSGITDEFIEPVRIEECPITEKDSLLFWNFRSDRMRQLVKIFLDGGISREKILCFTEYDRSLALPVLFPTEEITDHIGEVVSKSGLKQLRIAETEKYPHVTYFFNGGDENEAEGEDRILVTSPRDVKTYDEKPEMSAYEVTEKLVAAIKNDEHDYIVLNFANGDMVGHTGDLDAATKAIEVVDSCLGEILAVIEEKKGEALIIADHGNAEQMVNYETGEPHTAHTTYPVPAILFSTRKEKVSLKDGGALCDVAPTLLELLSLEQPKVMTGESLIETSDDN